MFTSRRTQRPYLLSTVLALVVAPLLTVGALAANVAATAPSITALNQKVHGADVSITYAYLPKDGSLTIFPSDASGRMAKEPVGEVTLKAGDYRNVKVQLSSQPKAGTRLWAVLEQHDGRPFKDYGRTAEQSFKAL